MSLTKPETEHLRLEQPPQVHVLKAKPETVHWGGYLDASLTPELTIDSGEIVCAEAVTQHAGDAPELMMDNEIGDIFIGRWARKKGSPFTKWMNSAKPLPRFSLTISPARGNMKCPAQ